MLRAAATRFDLFAVLSAVTLFVEEDTLGMASAPATTMRRGVGPKGRRGGSRSRMEREKGIIGKELCRFITRCRGRGQTFVAYAQIFCHEAAPANPPRPPAWHRPPTAALELKWTPLREAYSVVTAPGEKEEGEGEGISKRVHTAARVIRCNQPEGRSVL